MTLLIGLLVGIAFGAVLQLGGASRYEKILGTLLLRDLTILKLILTAIAVGTVGIYALDLGGFAHLSIKPTYVVGLILAGIIFGGGFALAGYCPGTSLVAAAEGKRDALFAIAGGFVGAFLYALVHPSLSGILDRGALGDLTLPNLLGVPGIVLAIPISAALVFALWRLIPDFPVPGHADR
jgi:uncharacterized membrane protein YedE/YeeE